ncbi:MAG TPA: autotransporter-associated beta strand repeat-containing protein, partial [Candidatus Binatia bacterium]|nr:autotransporter-associated beta strand repeat-containing protein [Candidatus Binatia bacterium]
MKTSLFAAVTMTLLLQAWSGRTATIVMTGSDGFGATSFNTGLNWSNGQPPAGGNAYQTAAYLLRTPANTADIAFAGDSLEIQNGGILRDKTAAAVTIANLILADGSTIEITQPNNVNNATASGSLAGAITLNGTAYLHAGIASDLPGETFIVQSTIGGTGGFTTAGSTGNVILSGTNSYAGGTTVNAGTLLINGVLVNSPVTITSGILGGTGVIKSPVTCQVGGTLQPGLGGTDTSTL